jgi:Domain of unknown function (DUF1844)
MADEKKIIVDEDWKSQVQAEKEAAEKEVSQKEAAQHPSPQSTRGAGTQPKGEVPLPPASLEMLVTTLVTEAMISLGQVPHPHTGEVLFQPQQAKYLIDTVDMLREKTKGNVTPEETELMEQLLHQLRLAYVQLTSAARPGAIETP